jgi:hypothetical protein
VGDGAAPRPDLLLVRAATGERIVAFGRSGKSLETSFISQFKAGRTDDIYGISAGSQPFLKPRWDKDTTWGAIRMVGTTKKREARKSLRQSGWITLDGGFAARPCIVQDISAAGAKITVDDASALSGRLRLAFERDARTGRKCEIVWREGKSLGVKFVR